VRLDRLVAKLAATDDSPTVAQATRDTEALQAALGRELEALEQRVQILMPRRLRKAAALYRYALRDAFMRPLTPREVDELDWYFRSRRGELVCPSHDRDLDLTTAARKFAAARYGALYRAWQQRGDDALSAMQSRTLRDHLQRGWGRMEFGELQHQYLQLAPLVGAAGGVEKTLDAGDNLTTA